MKTLQEQYNLIKEGKGHKDVFMKTALRQFPNLFNNLTPFPTAVKVLKQKSILSEGIGGIVTQNTANPYINWEKFLNEESLTKEKLISKYGKKLVDFVIDKDDLSPEEASDADYIDDRIQIHLEEPEIRKKFLNEEAKAEEKKPTKEVVDTETAGYDYKDPKNTDNLNFEEMLRGYYAEMKDPKNADKTEEQLREMVAKNLAKDPSFYVKDGAFGVKGIGYTDDIPGLKVSDKELKGEYASSGMEKVKIKENMVKLTDLLNEAIGGYIDLRPVGMTNENTKTDSEEDDHVGANTDADFEREQRAQLATRNENKKVAKKKGKKETVDSKLAEIEKAGKITTLEAQIEALDEAITTKNERISMVTEDDNLSELVDKAKMKEMQREVKDLMKRKAKMEKLYEKMCGKAYAKTEIVDEADEMDY